MHKETTFRALGPKGQTRRTLPTYRLTYLHCIYSDLQYIVHPSLDAPIRAYIKQTYNHTSTLHFIILGYISFHNITAHCMTLHHIAWHHVTLHTLHANTHTHTNLFAFLERSKSYRCISERGESYRCIFARCQDAECNFKGYYRCTCRCNLLNFICCLSLARVAS